MRTPHDPARVRQLAEEGSVEEAVLRAWTDPGAHPAWHARAQREVRNAMPVLAAALDRMERERVQ